MLGLLAFAVGRLGTAQEVGILAIALRQTLRLRHIMRSARNRRPNNGDGQGEI